MQPVVAALPDKTALIEYTQTVILEKIKAAIAQRGRCTIALSGGSTPKPLYAALAKADLPWDKLYIFWGDERYVPHEHADSNLKMARESWLDQVSIPAEQVLAVATDLENPEASARQYQETLQQFFPNELPPRFDVILLGMGDDGHTASLFPHTPVLQETERWVAVGEKAGQPRITFTAPLINQARTVIFLVAGANKQAALSQVFSETASPTDYPSKLVQPQGELYWLMDEAAAKGLPEQVDLIQTGE
ncbi:MAG: 6-phosphogluconolactonase [Cyanobacteria bacterium P01_A01_bin.114]